MPSRRGALTPTKAYRGSVQAVKAYRGSIQVWPAGGGTEFPYTFPFNLGDGGEPDPGGYPDPNLPTVYLTGQSWWDSETQLLAELANRGLDRTTITEFPFNIDVSGALTTAGIFAEYHALVTVPPIGDTSHITNMESMFDASWHITSVPDLQTGNVTSTRWMFSGTERLTDGNVRCIGKHPSVDSTGMIDWSGLTRNPFFDSNGNPI